MSVSDMMVMVVIVMVIMVVVVMVMMMVPRTGLRQCLAEQPRT